MPAGFIQETIPLHGSILQAGTCQIHSLYENLRWSNKELRNLTISKVLTPFKMKTITKDMTFSKSKASFRMRNSSKQKII